MLVVHSGSHNYNHELILGPLSEMASEDLFVWEQQLTLLIKERSDLVVDWSETYWDQEKQSELPAGSRYPRGSYWVMKMKPCTTDIPYASLEYVFQCQAENDQCLQPPGLHCHLIWAKAKLLMPKQLLVDKVHFGTDNTHHAVIVGPMEQLDETELVEVGRQLDGLHQSYRDLLNPKKGLVWFGAIPRPTPVCP